MVQTLLISPLRIIYLTIFILAFVLGIINYKYNKQLAVLVILLGVGLATEFFVEINKYITVAPETFIYNIYIPLEYLVYTIFFYRINTNRLLKKSILISIPIFLIVVLSMSKYSGKEVSQLSSEVYNISGIFAVIWSLCTLFTIEPIKNIKFTQHPLFWICSGIILFHSGIIPFNVMHNHVKIADKELFETVSKLFQKGLNIWLYVSFSIGFIYSRRVKKYS